MSHENIVSHHVNLDALPAKYPTNIHEADFWESLGRAVATFGFLEFILKRAIFALTATRQYEEAEIEQAYNNWIRSLESVFTAPLGSLIDSYGRAVRDHPDKIISNLDDLLNDLKKISEMRNVLCHGCWELPNLEGAALPYFANRKKLIVDTAMNCQYIDQVQRVTAEVSCEVISTVTRMGWRFPGSSGPGKSIM